MDGAVDREVVEQRRNDRGQRDRRVRHAHELGHHERHRTHHRRHDCPAHCRRRFHTAGKRSAVAELLHHRNRERAGGEHVGDAAARHRAEQARRHYGRLCRPADSMAEHRKREPREERTGAGGLQQPAEQQEQHHVLRHHQHRNAEDATVADEDRLQERLDAHRRTIEHARKAISEQRVHDEDGRQHDQRPAHGTPHRLDDDHDQHQRGDRVDRAHVDDALLPGLDRGEKVAEDPQARGHQQQVDGAPGVQRFVPAPAQREEQEQQRQRQAQVHRQIDDVGRRPIDADVEMEQHQIARQQHDEPAQHGRQRMRSATQQRAEGRHRAGNSRRARMTSRGAGVTSTARSPGSTSPRQDGS